LISLVCELLKKKKL